MVRHYLLLVGMVWCASIACGAEAPKLQGYALGSPQPSPDVLRVGAGGLVTLKAAGLDATGHQDDGSFAGMETDALNFTFVARVAKGVAGGRNPKYGIAVREGLAKNARVVSVRYDGWEGNRCIQWFMRYHVVGSTHHGSQRCFLDGADKRFDKTEGMWLKLVRRYPYVDVFASDDGKAWRQLAYKPVLRQPKVWVGLHAVAGGAPADASATFDNISFTADSGDVSVETPQTYKEYAPTGKYTIWFAKLNAGTAASPAYTTAYVVVPHGMDPARMRALLWTPGSKELLLADGNSLPFASGPAGTPEAGMRFPPDMKEREGPYVTDKLTPEHAMLAHYGILRMGSLAPMYHEAVKRVAELSKVPQIANLPFLSTGASGAGGGASAVARKFAPFAVATSPTLIGTAGIEEVDKHHNIPFLFIVGSRDGGHLAQIKQAAPVCRARHALWGSAPMWMVYHHPHKQKALMYPYFVDVTAMRVPADHDFAKGPAKLNELKEEDGYLGLIDTWETSFPQAVPFKQYKGDPANAVWLPNARVARAWQAFVSFNPRTVIHFPMFEGHNCIGQAQPYGWHNSHMAAKEPFEIVASGPVGEGLKVEFYSDLQPLRVLKQPDKANPYRLTVEGLAPGLHVLYAITTVDGRQEISRPVTVMFHARM